MNLCSYTGILNFLSSESVLRLILQLFLHLLLNENLHFDSSDGHNRSSVNSLRLVFYCGFHPYFMGDRRNWVSIGKRQDTSIKSRSHRCVSSRVATRRYRINHCNTG